MPTPFICTNCGHASRGLAPTREPVYGWLLARCEGCGRAVSVHPGGRHPALAVLRRLRGLGRLAGLLAIQLGGGAALLLVLHAAADSAVTELRGAGCSPWDVMGLRNARAPDWEQFADSDARPLLILLTCTAAALGVGARVTLPHWRPWAVALALVALGAAACVAAYFASAAESVLATLLELPEPSRIPALREWVDRAGMAAVFAGPMVVGVILGRLVAHSIGGLRRSRWRRRLRRRRASRITA